jgi:arylsulfatase
VRLLTARPSAIAGKTDFTYTGVNPGIPVGNAPSILNKDYTITAEVTIPSGGAEGVIATIGGRFGGYALMLSPSASWLLSSKPFKYIEWGLLIFGFLLIFIGTAGRWRKRFGYAFVVIAVIGLVLSFATDLFHIGRGRPVFVYNMLDLERFRWRGPSLDEGKHTIVFDFKYDGPGVGKGGTGVLTVDGKEVDRKSMEHTIPFLMPADESFDVGLDTRTPVDFTYDCPFHFTGSIDKLTFNLGPSQLSAEDQKKRDDAIARANN